MKRRSVSVLLLGALAVLLTSQPADAALAIRFLTDPDGAGGAAAVVTATCTSALNATFCTSSDAYFDVQLSTAITNVPGGATAQLGKTLNVSTTQLAVTSGATLSLEVYAYDFTGPTGAGTLIESVTANNPGGSAFGSIAGRGFIALPGGGANLFSTTGQFTPIASVTCLTPGGVGCGAGGFIGTDVESAAVTTSSPFAFTNRLLFDPNSAGISNFSSDLTLTAVPEPASVVFMGTALLSVSALLRKKFRRS
jgi:hypothetical protein